MPAWGKERDQKHLSPSPFNSCLCEVLTHSGSTALPHISHFYPLSLPPHLSPCPFFTYLPSPPLLLSPSLVRYLIRAGRTMVPLLPLFGNPGLKQMLFTKAVPHPRPSPSLQPSPSLIESASARINHWASFIPLFIPSSITSSWVIYLGKKKERWSPKWTGKTTEKTHAWHFEGRKNQIFSQWP